MHKSIPTIGNIRLSIKDINWFKSIFRPKHTIWKVICSYKDWIDVLRSNESQINQISANKSTVKASKLAMCYFYHEFLNCKTLWPWQKMKNDFAYNRNLTFRHTMNRKWVVEESLNSSESLHLLVLTGA